MLDAQLPAGHEVEKSFLFAAVAYQLDLLDASRLAQAWQAWTAQPAVPPGPGLSPGPSP